MPGSHKSPLAAPSVPRPENSLSVYRLILFGILWLLVCVLLFRQPLRQLVVLAATNDNDSHILLIPFISGWLLFLDRKQLLRARRYDFIAPLVLLLPAVVIAGVCVLHTGLNASVRLALLTFALILCIQAGFLALFGGKTAEKAWFPLAFLLLAIPLPDSVLDRFIYLLQSASADLAELLFDWTGVPALRQGFIFRLPRLSIEVAKECSGIRSSIALLVLAILISHFSFRPFWKKLVFVATGLVMMVVKNGVRIATLTILANYVDPQFLYGRLHHEGGVVFFLLGLLLMLPIYWILRRGEAETVKAKPAASAA